MRRSPAEIFCWNPRRSDIPGLLGRYWPIREPVNNFGDLLGPLIVRRLAQELGRDVDKPVGRWQLMSVGSVLHMARDGAIVWGSGINGKMPSSTLTFSDLDVRAVRGPATAKLLRRRGIVVPDVYGDPGLLVARLFPDLQSTTPGARRFRVAIVPNLNDDPHVGPVGQEQVVVNPRAPLMDVLRIIANSELVVGSSLHGIVVAESFGIAARLVAPQRENMFKYVDYYESTGRSCTPARTVDAAIDAGGEPSPTWDPTALMKAFPVELWAPAGTAGT